MPVKKKDDTLDRVEMKLDLFKEHFDSNMINVKNQLDKVEVKIESVDSRMDNIDVTAAKHHVVLDEHVRRANLLEEKIEHDKREIKEEIEPLKIQSAQLKLALKVAAAILGAGAGGIGIKELISLFIK